jgi:hypothetical protein
MSEDSTMGAHNGIPVAPSESDDQIRNEGDIMQEDLEICSHRPFSSKKLSLHASGPSSVSLNFIDSLSLMLGDSLLML